MKIPAAIAAVDKEWENWTRFRRGTTKVRNKSDVNDEARKEGRKVHFASLMDLCHFKNAELETKHQKDKGRVVLRGDIVKDDSGSYAVFTEQGSSAFQMTAAKVMDIISRLPGCAGQAADAISACTPGTNGRCSQIIENSQIGVSRYFGFVYHDKIAQIMVQYGEKILLKHGWEKIPNWECLFVHREKGIFLSVYVDDIKLATKKQNINPMWKLLNKEVDLGEPTSFLDHVYQRRTQRQCEINKDIVDDYRTMFESRISAGATEKLPCLENLTIPSWSYDMERHAKKCVERYCELANKTTLQSINSMP